MANPTIAKLVVAMTPMLGKEISVGIILALRSTNLLAKSTNTDFDMSTHIMT